MLQHFLGFLSKIGHTQQLHTQLTCRSFNFSFLTKEYNFEISTSATIHQINQTQQSTHYIEKKKKKTFTTFSRTLLIRTQLCSLKVDCYRTCYISNKYGNYTKIIARKVK